MKCISLLKNITGYVAAATAMITILPVAGAVGAITAGGVTAASVIGVVAAVVDEVYE